MADSKEAITGNVFNIERHALHDGPGIRTVVFLSDCPLSCKWCSNPDCFADKVLYIWQKQCNDCGYCVKYCPRGAISMVDGKMVTDRALCDVCGICTNYCPQGARETAGARMTVDEVMRVVERDKMFYQTSGGGLTLSGGEPFMQDKFAAALFEECIMQGISTAVETSGSVPWENIEPSVEFVNVFLFDIKHMDPEKHRYYTGMDNRLILENIRKLSERGANITVRVPVVPGVNDTAEEIGAIAQFAAGLAGVHRIDLLPFHKLAISKHEALGTAYEMADREPLDGETVDRLVAAAKEKFDNVHVEV